MIEGKNRELYFGDSVYKQMNIEIVGTNHVIDNSMREQDTFSLTETLCDESELRFGSCLPNKISFIGRDIPLATKGMKLRPVEILEGNEDDPFYYGEYTVYSDVPTSDRPKREITAYDAMYDIINADVKQWYAGLTFPITLRQFRDSFFSHLGIIQKETTLVNDGMTVNKTLITESSSDSNMTEVDSISGKTVVEAICEINGVFGNINRDGLFEYVELEPIIKPLYPSNDLYPREDLFPREPNTISMTGHYVTFDYEDFQSKAITQLEIRPSDDSAGVIVGISGNNYVISGNFLVSDKTGAELEAIAENTLSVIKKAAYIPIKSSEIVGNPCIELGDPIRFNTTREIIESYVLQRTLTGIQSKRDSITASGTETHSANVNSIKDTISNLSGRTNKLERSADHTLSELADLDASTTSRFEQTAEQIQTEVTRATGAESTLQSSITQTADAITAEVTRATEAESDMSTRISQTAHSVSISASGSGNTASINIELYDENGNLIDTTKTANITITGFVSFQDLSNAGQTTINGANITTGDISCDRLNGGTIKGQNLEGCKAEFSDGAESLRLKYSDDYYMGLRAGYIFLHNKNPGYVYQSIVSDNLLRIGVNDNADCWGDGLGSLSPNTYIEINKYGRINLVGTNIMRNGSQIATTSQIPTDYAKTSDLPNMSNYVTTSTFDNHNHDMSKLTYSLTEYGNVELSSVNLASTSWVSNKFQQKSSDIRLKTEISDLQDMSSFYMQLSPKKYRFKNGLRGYDDRLHYGFIAQEIESIITENSNLVYKTLCDRDLSNENEIIGDEYFYCVDKDELHAMHVQMIQKHQKEIELLKQENLALQNRLSILEQKMEILENAYNNKNN